MRVILTHEQADFDALASLLGAYLLDDSAFPVLPRRMNRNVRAFVTLYGAELPFIEQRDLPNEPVESVYLVDTQSMITVKGIGSETRVHVVDHHPRRGDLPAHWVMTTSDVGSTATLLVEALRDRNGHLGLIQATLLLLGIYEDTGSLTYTRTSSRDLEAAAYLLDHGASLQIAVEFLNHPLSTVQQALYDYLRSTAQTLNIHGHTVIVARGEALEMEEELSSIAHKLRDLLDPDALILLITTRNGVQLIARSTVDQIDVAQIAAQFGGGGHVRASAGLIRGRSQEEIYTELVKSLPSLINPAITVAQIMSRDPQVLTPDTLAQDALERMQRYGYEGYPIVKNNRVVGLLTRRDVDRSLSHKLNYPAYRLMSAGEVTVSPDDSIEHLQRLMTNTGWGQVPVVAPESGHIVGIVTRTDLLKTLTTRLIQFGTQNLASRLEMVLPPARLALLKAVAHTAADQKVALFIVGGFVRDLLLERPSLDFDLVVEGDAITLGQRLAEKYGGRITTHARFGTAKWHLKRPGVGGKRVSLASLDSSLSQGSDLLPAALDLITARTEFYTHPTALPTVERGSIKLDLHRRDFTINTLALRLDGRHYAELHDYWGGLSDLRQGLVRVLHSLSSVNDFIRMLRAVRFEQRFKFDIEDRTLQLLQEAVSLLGRVSGDRIRHELNYILLEDRAVPMLARLSRLGLLPAIHPDLVWDGWLEAHFRKLEQAFRDGPHPGLSWGLPVEIEHLPLRSALFYMLWLVRVPEERLNGVMLRLHIPRSLETILLQASRLWQGMQTMKGMPPSQVVARLEGLPLPALYVACLASDDTEVCEQLQNYALRWSKVLPVTTGHELRARGLPPGPAFRDILPALRNAWLDGNIASPEEETALLNQLLEKHGRQSN